MDKIEPKELPVFYYWDYFEFILSYLKKHYLALLSEEELHFLSVYDSLSFEAQCLLIRLGSRKPKWFHQHKISYTEIPNLPQVLDELKVKNLIGLFSSNHAADCGVLFQELTKDELYALVKQIEPEFPLPKSSNKESILQVLADFDTNILVKEIPQLYPNLITLHYREIFDFFQFLFFGSKARDLTDFVVKDLGFRKFFEVKEDEFIPYFTSREEALEKWKISNWNERFFLESKKNDSVYFWLDSWKCEVLPILPTICDLSLGAFERSVMNLGRFMERQGYLEESLEVYEYGLGSKSLERRIRILSKLKRQQEAIQWAKVGLELFQHPNDAHFYIDFLGRVNPEKTIKQVTQKLKHAEKVVLVQDQSLSVEAQVAMYYQELGYEAVFTENTIWKNLMGLLTWEIIFDAQQQAFSHPFQYAPSTYRMEGFGLEHLAVFHQKMALLEDEESFWLHIERIKEQHTGKLNPLIDWDWLNVDHLAVLVRNTSTKALQQVLEQLWVNVATHAKGFPDLMVWNEQELFFVEVKSPNDHLSPIQFFWNEVLNNVGICSKIVRIAWKK